MFVNNYIYWNCLLKRLFCVAEDVISYQIFRLLPIKCFSFLYEVEELNYNTNWPGLVV
jgi:hypothetical protein